MILIFVFEIQLRFTKKNIRLTNIITEKNTCTYLDMPVLLYLHVYINELTFIEVSLAMYKFQLTRAHMCNYISKSMLVQSASGKGSVRELSRLTCTYLYLPVSL